MKDYTTQTQLWNSYQKETTAIVREERISSIGNDTFYEISKYGELEVIYHYSTRDSTVSKECSKVRYGWIEYCETFKE